jgi:hypothetical protein
VKGSLCQDDFNDTKERFNQSSKEVARASIGDSPHVFVLVLQMQDILFSSFNLVFAYLITL